MAAPASLARGCPLATAPCIETAAVATRIQTSAAMGRRTLRQRFLCGYGIAAAGCLAGTALLWPLPHAGQCSPRALRAVAHGLSAHRRRANGALQLALGKAAE